MNTPKVHPVVFDSQAMNHKSSQVTATSNNQKMVASAKSKGHSDTPVTMYALLAVLN